MALQACLPRHCAHIAMAMARTKHACSANGGLLALPTTTSREGMHHVALVKQKTVLLCLKPAAVADA
jgi:hypothetical protein